MKKAFLLIIASALLAAEPLMAVGMNVAEVPNELSDNTLNRNDTEGVDPEAQTEDSLTSEDLEAMQGYYPRYCPRGFVRRCFCMRRGWPRRPFDIDQGSQHAPLTPAIATELNDNGSDMNDPEAVEQSESGDMEAMQGYYPRYCPRGYVRRCRCVRYRYPGPRRPPYDDYRSQQGPFTPMEKSDENPTTN